MGICRRWRRWNDYYQNYYNAVYAVRNDAHEMHDIGGSDEPLPESNSGAIKKRKDKENLHGMQGQ